MDPISKYGGFTADGNRWPAVQVATGGLHIAPDSSTGTLVGIRVEVVTANNPTTPGRHRREPAAEV